MWCGRWRPALALALAAARRWKRSLTGDRQTAAGAEQSGGKVLAGKMYLAGNTQAGSIIDRSTKNSSQDRRSQFGCMQIYDEPQDAWTINDK